jgi:murein DD-endopeptidase MepM/ murein hydrolase activator NlpD
MCSGLLALLLLVSNEDVVHEYDRREAAILEQLARRQAHVRARLRSLWKLSRGGYARLLLESSSRADFYTRRAAASRIVRRDLVELGLYARERRMLAEERDRLRAEATAGAVLPIPSLSRAPVAARFAIAARFGPYHDAESGLELGRRGVLLAVRSGTPVVSPASGTVRFAGTIPGLGETVVIEHDGELFTVLYPLADRKVAEGARLSPGDAIGRAAPGGLSLEVRHGGTPLDPEPLLRHTSKR